MIAADGQIKQPEIDYLNEFSSPNTDEIQRYIEILLEIAQRDRIAINQAEIYIDYLTDIVEDLKRDLKHSMLLENVTEKIEVIKNSNLFEIDGIEENLKNTTLDELEDIHGLLVEKYVSLNKNEVIVECFFNLKLEGVYTNNEKLADELIEKAQIALNTNDYDELFSIVNVLYEIDERTIK